MTCVPDYAFSIGNLKDIFPYQNAEMSTGSQDENENLQLTHKVAGTRFLSESKKKHPTTKLLLNKSRDFIVF